MRITKMVGSSSEDMGECSWVQLHIGNTRFDIRQEGDGVEFYKVTSTGRDDLSVQPVSGNVIIS